MTNGRARAFPARQETFSAWSDVESLLGRLLAREMTDHRKPGSSVWWSDVARCWLLVESDASGFGFRVGWYTSCPC